MSTIPERKRKVLRQSYSQIQSAVCGPPGFVLKRERRCKGKISANVSLGSEVESGLTTVGLHQRGGERRLDYLKAK